MGLSSDQLEAFAEVVKRGSFSSASKSLFLSQSALSQRVLNLEDELGTSLLVRGAQGLSLTPAGEVLLRYTQTKNNLELEVLGQISTSQKQISGPVRIGAFSSVARSALMPALSQLIVTHKPVTLQLFSKELHELTRMLDKGEVDFILTSQDCARSDLESHRVGMEEYVLIEGRQASIGEVYFDHDPEDQTTFKFFQMQTEPLRDFRRSYLDEIYALIDAVALGWGRAVVPRHLIQTNESIRVLTEWRTLEVPVYLQYFRQPFYSNLHLAVREEILNAVPKYLKVTSEAG